MFIFHRILGSFICVLVFELRKDLATRNLAVFHSYKEFLFYRFIVSEVVRKEVGYRDVNASHYLAIIQNTIK